uniref:NADH dehydrogenase subunit 2 n=1 Tax=Leontynka pallida TaxID=2912034 RepID=UPI002028CA32|nr:NADH dehydrogenase subunit 2 [Leontynka pallida]UPQ43828.1 NADH dehydrogenase subunit 2 [Leontynka pallida]
MFWCCLPELDLLFGLLMLIVYGLISASHKHVSLVDVHLFCCAWPLLSVAAFVDLSAPGAALDVALAVLTASIMLSFKSLESMLLILMGYVGQAFMLHSCDLVSFYVCLEMQNFSFLVLAGLSGADADRLSPWKGAGAGIPAGATSVAAGAAGATSAATSAAASAAAGSTSGSVVASGSVAASGSVVASRGASRGFSVLAALKYMLLSAFSSGMILFWFSQLYLRTGSSAVFSKGALSVESFLILVGLLFKMGAAPIHLWVVHIYQMVSRRLILYISTAPKLSLFGFWVSAWHMDYTVFGGGVAAFAVFSLLLGSFGAYGQPALRQLFAYSTVAEIGLLLLALETAGFHTLFQHLAIYICSQMLLWNLSDKRAFSLVAVSLAGLPPLAGFFGKAWIFWHAAGVHAVTLLTVALFCTGISLVYYLRALRIFWYRPTGQVLDSTRSTLTTAHAASYGSGSLSPVWLCSLLSSSLLFAPIFLVKPFVL